MFRRPQPENFINYQLQASLGRRQQGRKIPIKRRKRTKIKKEKRNDSFLLRQQDIDKRRAVYRPDRLLELHQSALTNATRTSTEIGRGLTATGTTLGFERQQEKDASLEKAKGRVLLALANKLEKNEPLIGIGVNPYAQHRQPEDFNAIRLPDREQKIRELGYREPREEPPTTGYSSHRKPNDDNSNLVQPLLQSFEVEEEPEVEDVTDQTPIPRVEKPKVGKLDPSRTQALEGLTFQVADADDPRVKQATQNAEQQRNIARQQAGTNEPQPQVRKPKPKPQPRPEPEPEPKPEPEPELQPEPELEPEQPKSIYEQWKQAGTRAGGTGEFAPPEVEQTSTKPVVVREKTQAPPTPQQQRQLDAAAESKRRRQERFKEKFGQLRQDITEPEEGEPLPLRRETQSIEDFRKVVEESPSIIRAKARQEVEQGVFAKPPLPPSRPPSRQPTPPTSGRTTPARSQSARTLTPTGSAGSDPPEPLRQNFVEPQSEGRGQVEDVEEEESWLDSLPDKSSFHSGIATNELTGSTYSFVDTDGIVGGGKFQGKELAILGVNKKGNVLLQLKDTIGTGKVDAKVRANISYKKFKANLEDLNLKPLNP